MSWTHKMYAASAVGSTFAVFWPTIIKLMRVNQPEPLGDKMTAGKRYGVYLGMGVVIGIVVAALGFAALLGSKENQDSLRAAGSVAYFVAFTGGFSAGALFEEPLKKA